MKKILLLGGSEQQIVAITTAKELGYYTILCDFLEDNPGQYISDEFFLVSTTDKDAVLEIAKKEMIDGILAYASDPAAPTAAYVAEKLGLPGNPYKSVDILCNKDKFREFLSKNEFYSPKAKGYSNINDAINDFNKAFFNYPVIIKPVDSSGSKGVNRCDTIQDIEKKLENSLSYSRCKRIIVEEYVDKYGYQVAGDGLSINGKLVFRCFANDHFNLKCINPFVPISASFPYSLSEEIQHKIHDEIQRLLTLLEMKNCTYNFDIRIDKNMNVYLMEVAPRNGGNYIPNIIKYSTGIDLVEYSVKFAMGENVKNPNQISQNGYWSYFAVHSLKKGKLKKITINDDVIKNNIVENHILKKEGENIESFIGANSTLGCLIMKFDNMNDMLYMMDNSEEWIKVEVF